MVDRQPSAAYAVRQLREEVTVPKRLQPKVQDLETFRSSVSKAPLNNQRVKADQAKGTKHNYIFHIVTSLFVLPKSCPAPRPWPLI